MYKAKAAYGRTYSCQAEAMRDWESGKDFKLVDGPYFSVRDFDSLKRQAMTDKVLYNEKYVLEIWFISTTKEGWDKFFVNFKGVCVASIHPNE